MIPALDSFASPLRAAVFGATGGIGRAVTQLLLESSRVEQVYAFARRSPEFSGAKVTPGRFDLNDEDSIQSAATVCREAGALHLVFVATGVLHSERLQPEKSWQSLSAATLAESFAINTIGPALIAKHFLGLLALKKKSVFAAISARVGSIEGNQLGGWHSYRAAKAALHQIIRTNAVELKRRNPAAICMALHPGTVDTALSKPFQVNLDASKLFSPQFAAEKMLTVINNAKPIDSGNVFAWDGQRISF